MPGILIGINPPSEVNYGINRMKEKVIQYGNMQQTKEPPHITLVTNDFNDYNKVDEALTKLTKNYSSMPVEIKGMTYFPPEKSSGLYVVHAAVQKSDALQRLQEDIVKQTAEYAEGCALCEYFKKNMPDYQYTEEEKTNVGKYGFPYVGNNWMPHLTVAFLDKPTFDNIGQDMLSQDFNYRFDLNEITLFTYDKKWVPYKTYKLGF